MPYTPHSRGPEFLSPLHSPTAWDMKDIFGLDRWARASLSLLPISGAATTDYSSVMPTKAAPAYYQGQEYQTSFFDPRDERPQTPELVQCSPQSSPESTAQSKKKKPLTKSSWKDFMANKSIPEGFDPGENPTFIPAPVYNYDLAKAPTQVEMVVMEGKKVEEVGKAELEQIEQMFGVERPLFGSWQVRDLR